MWKLAPAPTSQVPVFIGKRKRVFEEPVSIGMTARPATGSAPRRLRAETRTESRAPFQLNGCCMTSTASPVSSVRSSASLAPFSSAPSQNWKAATSRVPEACTACPPFTAFSSAAPVRRRLSTVSPPRISAISMASSFTGGPWLMTATFWTSSPCTPRRLSSG